jgi:hypothetical protein
MLLSGTAAAEVPNLAEPLTGRPGAVSRLVLASQTMDLAVQSGDPLLVIAAIRLARGVALREPTAWEKSTSPEGENRSVAEINPTLDPGSPDAILMARDLAGDDPDLQDLVYDLDAQLPAPARATAFVAVSVLPAAEETWRMPINGDFPAEFALIPGTYGTLSLTITDDADNLVCAVTAANGPALCRFTPARNGFFTVRIGNPGSEEVTYRLVGN